MGLINSLWGRSRGDAREGNLPEEAQDSSLAHADSRNNLRRDLVYVVLRDTMRIHGVPSEWMRATVLTTDSAERRSLHVLLIVCDGHDRMLAYLPAFQESFLAALGQFDGAVSAWMSRLSWQFEGLSKQPERSAAAAPLTARADSGAPAGPLAIAASDELDEDLQEDLRRLFEIRDGALQTPSPTVAQPDFQPTQPLG